MIVTTKTINLKNRETQNANFIYIIRICQLHCCKTVFFEIEHRMDGLFLEKELRIRNHSFQCV